MCACVCVRVCVSALEKGGCIASCSPVDRFESPSCISCCVQQVAFVAYDTIKFPGRLIKSDVSVVSREGSVGNVPCCEMLVQSR